MGTLLEKEWIEEFAEDLAIAYNFSSPPIDPRLIAKQEGITVIGENFEDAFDGRLEYVSGNFVIFYNNKYGEEHPRVRFTIAHEIGHFYMDEHRSYLMQGGEAHGSKVDFISDNRIERMADAFAASLLMPNYLFAERVSSREPDLSHIKNLAREFQTSFISTSIRYIEVSDFACALVVSNAGIIQYSFISKYMDDLGYKYIPNKTSIPKSSPTFSLVSKQQAGKVQEQVEDEIDASDWFDLKQSRDRRLLEQATLLNNQKVTLTLLCLSDYKEFEDANLD